MQRRVLHCIVRIRYFKSIVQIKAKLGGCALPDGSVPFSDLTPILSDLGLSDQEILTLARHFGANPGQASPEIEKTIRLAQEKLRKKASIFNSLAKMIRINSGVR